MQGYRGPTDVCPIPFAATCLSQQGTNPTVQVTGTLTPDAAGQYYESGTYEDMPTYTHINGLYHIWLADGLLWTINSEIGNLGTAFLWQTVDDQFGIAVAYGTATGIATISMI